MEKNNNYYTPEIEEFHEGFRYEWNDYLGDNKWVNRKYTIKNYLTELEGSLKSQIRVKSLDQSDIEELGWKYKGKSIDIWFEKEGTFDMGSFRVYKIKLQYGLHDNRLRVVADDQGSDYVLFTGKIKKQV